MTFASIEHSGRRQTANNRPTIVNSSHSMLSPIPNGPRRAAGCSVCCRFQEPPAGPPGHQQFVGNLDSTRIKIPFSSLHRSPEFTAHGTIGSEDSSIDNGGQKRSGWAGATMIPALASSILVRFPTGTATSGRVCSTFRLLRLTECARSFRGSCHCDRIKFKVT